MLTKLPIPYDLCVGAPFNQDKALVGSFSVIVKREPSFEALR